ncbi:hypothetical protein KFL_013240015 [Klebsormidium nitens]|uniref:J domain-containing protein n=1 Tax=Klebsormidium nitens TaxID=105231 RepID=A0A1Y1IU85_KLENI|nr:hypothetical protein KFL_013240015 [Klebsormidium nitens]|eukprot:GAQ93149.1 hypothetical protein KFL_013240015 [Klebsormidium nitens]
MASAVLAVASLRFYNVLGASRTDSRGDIRKARGERLLRFHPDKVQQSGQKLPVKADAVQSINDACQTLEVAKQWYQFDLYSCACCDSPLFEADHQDLAGLVNSTNNPGGDTIIGWCAAGHPMTVSDAQFAYRAVEVRGLPEVPFCPGQSDSINESLCACRKCADSQPAGSTPVLWTNSVCYECRNMEMSNRDTGIPMGRFGMPKWRPALKTAEIFLLPTEEQGFDTRNADPMDLDGNEPKTPEPEPTTQTMPKRMPERAPRSTPACANTKPGQPGGAFRPTTEEPPERAPKHAFQPNRPNEKCAPHPAPQASSDSDPSAARAEALMKRGLEKIGQRGEEGSGVSLLIEASKLDGYFASSALRACRKQAVHLLEVFETVAEGEKEGFAVTIEGLLEGALETFRKVKTLGDQPGKEALPKERLASMADELATSFVGFGKSIALHRILMTALPLVISSIEELAALSTSSLELEEAVKALEDAIASCAEEFSKRDPASDQTEALRFMDEEFAARHPHLVRLEVSPNGLCAFLAVATGLAAQGKPFEGGVPGLMEAAWKQAREHPDWYDQGSLTFAEELESMIAQYKRRQWNHPLGDAIAKKHLE